MPAEQQGQVYRTRDGFGLRWYDENGVRRRQAGFSSPSKARAWFRDVEVLRMRGGLVSEPLTLREFAERYVARYRVDRAPATIKALEWRLVRPLAEFGDVLLTELRTGEIAAWEATLPRRFRHDVVRTLRQVLEAAVAWEYLPRNPAKSTGRNPAPPVIERSVLEPDDVDRLAGEMRSPFDVAVLVGAWCFLRPAELLALERRDLGDGVLDVRGTKTARSRRTVPVPLRAFKALSELPPRLGTRLLFPSPQGDPYDACNWRRREFNWAREAAGLADDVTPYVLRHSGISWALHAGIPANDVARFAGTSVAMLETCYHHLLSTSTEAARRRLDVFADRSGQEWATQAVSDPSSER
jgi:integrase